MKKWNVLWAMCLTLLLASTVRSQTAVNNAELNGDYAFSFNGMTTGGGSNWTPFAAVGRFTADGAGNLTNGELDANGFRAMEKAVAPPFTGPHPIGADRTGRMNPTLPCRRLLPFPLMPNA